MPPRLNDLANRELNAAAENTQRSSQLQDELERTLSEVQRMQRMSDRVDANLEKAADSKKNQQALERADAIAALIDNVRRTLAQSAQDRQLDELERDLQKAEGALTRSGATRPELEEQARNLKDAAKRAGLRAERSQTPQAERESSAELQKKLDELAKELAAAAAERERSDQARR